MKLGMLVYISLSYERLLSDGMPASTLYHTFGSTIRNPRKSTPTMCLILTLLLNTCRNEPLAPASDFRTLPKSSASTIITTIQPAAREPAEPGRPGLGDRGVQLAGAEVSLATQDRLCQGRVDDAYREHPYDEQDRDRGDDQGPRGPPRRDEHHAQGDR